MKKEAVLNLLSDHADALIGAEDASEFDSHAWLSTYYPSESEQALMLLRLAQAIRWALVPVTTPEPFKADLGQLLNLASPDSYLEGKRSYHRAFLCGAAAFGLFLLMSRRFRLGQGQNQSHSMSSAI